VLLDQFNTAPAEELRPDLLACCDVPAWADTVLEGRPYDDLDALVATADKAARGFDAADVDRALARHPRIGERAAGQDTGSRWSRQEQSGVDADAQEALVEGNRAYEDRFNRVFLICATGLSAEQILTDLRRRLGNDDATEAAVVADELRKIALLRLRKLVDAE
jgi:2-oxo-4-hydroxy-4-carboxy-5-ureidoimidazoline decarboxylase